MEAYLAYPDLRKPLELLCPIAALLFLELYTNGVVQSGSGFFYPHVTTWRCATDEGISTSFLLLSTAPHRTYLLESNSPLMRASAPPPHRTYSPLMASTFFLTIMNKAYIKICMEI